MKVPSIVNTDSCHKVPFLCEFFPHAHIHGTVTMIVSFADLPLSIVDKHSQGAHQILILNDNRSLALTVLH